MYQNLILEPILSQLRLSLNIENINSLFPGFMLGDFAVLYKWIVFLPSKTHPNVPVLNRYYGAKEDGTIKIRGLEVWRRDTPKFVYDTQLEMIKALASADNSKGFVEKIPDALKVVKEYRKKLLDGEVPVWDLIVTKRLSKDLEDYTQKVS